MAAHTLCIEEHKCQKTVIDKHTFKFKSQQMSRSGVSVEPATAVNIRTMHCIDSDCEILNPVDEVVVKEDSYYDIEDAPTDWSKEDAPVFEEKDQVKCGEVLVGKKGNFTFICAICSMHFDSMQPFGLHVQAEHVYWEPEHSARRKGISVVAIDSLMSPDPARNQLDSRNQHPEGNNLTWKQTLADENDLVQMCEAKKRNVDGKLSCTYCNLKFQSKMLLLLHTKKEHSEPTVVLTLMDQLSPETQSCKYCDEGGFIDAKKLNEHIQTHGNPPLYTCPYCPKKHRSKASKNNHLNVHTGRRPFACHLCQKSFRFPSQLTNHKHTHKIEHFRTIIDVVKEKGCPGETSTNQENNSLNIAIAKETNDKEARLVCLYCSKTYKRRAKLVAHMKYKHDRQPKGRIPIPFPENAMCPYCNVKFEKASEFKTHIDSHAGPYKFSCLFCSKSFKQKSKMLAHRNTHFRKHPDRSNLKARKRPLFDIKVTKDVPEQGIQTDEQMQEHFSTTYEVKIE